MSHPAKRIAGDAASVTTPSAKLRNSTASLAHFVPLVEVADLSVASPPQSVRFVALVVPSAFVVSVLPSSFI